MKKFTRFIALFIALISMTFSLIGCVDPSVHEPEAVFFLIGRQEHFPTVDIGNYSKEIFDICYNYGTVSYALMQGSPEIGAICNIDPPSITVDKEKRTQIANRETKKIIEEMSTIQPVREEVDILGSIKLASNDLKAKPESVKRLVIISNFISTTGLLDFTTGELIMQDPGYIADQLVAAHAVPDLSFVDSITIYGFGQTCGSGQAKLTDDFILRMKELYLAIFEAGGCDRNKVHLNDTPLENIVPSGLPHVAAVPVPDVTIAYAEPTAAPTAEPTATPLPTEEPLIEPVNLIEDLHFVGDSAELIDPDLAISKLEDVAEIIITHPECRFILIGGCAGDRSTEEDSFGWQLSCDRAKTIYDLLLLLGVPASQVDMIGRGSLAPRHVPGLGTGDAGRLNRVVWIYNIGSPEVQELMELIAG